MQTFKKILLAATVATIASAQLFAASPRRGFAVVIDARSYEEARRQVDDYAAEIGKSGLEVHFVIDRTGQPDSLRHVLRQLWGQPKAPIEGAVLIGDIPVVMVRDAQHLTSAFKMDQAAFDRWESSVPSDRFYDDFSLEFAPTRQPPSRMFLLFADRRVGPADPSRHLFGTHPPHRLQRDLAL